MAILLRKAKPKAVFKIGSAYTILNRGDVVGAAPPGAALARAVAAWSITEAHMMELFVHAVGIDNDAALAMYTALHSSGPQLAAVHQAIAARLPEALRGPYMEIKGEFGSARAERDKIAHWLWGGTDASPGALVCTDPKHWIKWVRQRDDLKSVPPIGGDVAISDYPFDVELWTPDDFDYLTERCRLLQDGLRHLSLTNWSDLGPILPALTQTLAEWRTRYRDSLADLKAFQRTRSGPGKAR